MTKVQTNSDLRDVLEFHKYVNVIKGNEHEWTAHGDLLKRVLHRLYDTPGCSALKNSFAPLPSEIIHDVVALLGERNELKFVVNIHGNWGNAARKQTTFYDSFAYLSYDIIHEVVNSIEEPEQLAILEKFNGTWGILATKQQKFLEEFEPQYGDTEFPLCENRPFRLRWERLLRKAPRLHGKLCLSGLCLFVGSGEELYSALKPQFYDIYVDYHRTGTKRSTEELKHLRGFLKRQLQSPCLRKLRLEIIGDLDLEAELLTFCLSRNFEYLEWKCGPLSTDFFVQLYNGYKSNQIATDGKRKLIDAYLNRSALKKIVQTLKLKREEKKYEKIITFSREERFANLELSISIDCESDKIISVTVQLRHVGDDCAIPLNVCETEQNDVLAESLPKKRKIAEESEEDFADLDDYNRDDDKVAEVDCDGDCELEHMDSEYWIVDDCADCEGCHLCEPFINEIYG